MLRTGAIRSGGRRIRAHASPVGDINARRSLMNTVLSPRRRLLPLLGLAVLAAALFAAAGPANPADAAAGEYRIDLEYQYFRLDNIGDGAFNSDAEVYGTFYMQTSAGGNAAFNLGQWGNPSGCEAEWGTPGRGHCAKKVSQGLAKDLRYTEVC